MYSLKVQSAIHIVENNIQLDDDNELLDLVTFIRNLNSVETLNEELFRKFRDVWETTIEESYDDFYLLITPKYGEALQYIPVSDRNIDICMKAILNTPSAIRYIDERDRSLDMCKCAVYQDPSLYTYCEVNGVLTNMRHEMLMFMVSQDPRYITVINQMEPYVTSPNIPMVQSLVNYAISLYPELIKDIKVCFRNEYVCSTAVNHDGLLLEYVPNQTRDMIFDALDNNPLSLRFIKNLTEEICEKAFSKEILEIFYKHVDRYAGGDLKSSFMDLSVLMAQNLKYVPQRYMTEDICKRAYSYHESAKTYIPSIILQTFTT